MATLYQGDDLINLMTVYVRKDDGSLPELERVDVVVGSLVLKYDHPSNPFTIDIMRDKSIKLSAVNKCYACAYYYRDVNGVPTLVKKTCEGTLTINVNPEVVSDGRCEC